MKTNRNALRVRCATLLLLATALFLRAQSITNASFAPKPVPLMQVIPLPLDQVSFQRDGTEIARYYFATNLARPFLYPIIGPSGRSLTRMGHPHDPETHSHHNSVWISHAAVNGLSFWEDRGPGKIVHQRVERLEDGPEECALVVYNAWRAENRVLLYERRQMTARNLPNHEWLLLLDLHLEANGDEVTLGQTAFGLLGVRMAKTIGVLDGGGTLRNSEGGQGETAIFRKPARWMDYSGPITATAAEGITLLDHPINLNYPSVFHVRNDGWMGAALTFPGKFKLAPGKPLRLRYGLYIHAGIPAPQQIEACFTNFTNATPPNLTQRVKP
ncbi:MAG: PmoA family protein [Verrucomicrobiota bacterium]